jgi:hypothetical protein
MTKALLALSIAAVALSAAPAQARHDRTCAKWRHGQCVRWANHGYSRNAYRVGYRFGPSYGYTSYDALPRTYVRRYGLRPNYRYVYRDNQIYVVDPTTYAVTRIIDSVTR